MLSHELSQKSLLPTKAQSLPGRVEAIQLENRHFVHSRPIQPPFASNTSLELQQALFGLGCFWGAERKFWMLEGVYTTAVGYGAGYTPNPSYEEVCSGLTGHNELVLVVFEPAKVSFEQLLVTFFESHNPTQGMAQGNDRGTQYRSGIYYFDDEQKKAATQVRDQYQRVLSDQGFGLITTEIQAAGEFYYAEQYHQQYLAKNPNGYCGLGGTGVSYAKMS